jgi:hypothetical protein
MSLKVSISTEMAILIFKMIPLVRKKTILLSTRSPVFLPLLNVQGARGHVVLQTLFSAIVSFA